MPYITVSPFWLRCLAILTIGTLTSWSAAADPQTGFLLKTFTDETGEHRYSLYVPPEYTPDREWPVVLFLHGAGERGKDGLVPTQVGLGETIRRSKTPFPAIVVFPQVENQGRILTAWSPKRPDGQRALAILKQVEQEYKIDPHRRVLTGWSMGGYGTWQIAQATPEMWSTILPLAGGGGTGEGLGALKPCRIWAFHGARDEIVRVDQSQQTVKALEALGGTPTFTELPVAHGSWEAVYANPQVREWMFSTSGAPPKEVDWTFPDRGPDFNTDEPFFVEAIVPRAIGLRLGNNALAALARGIPAIVPADVLRGKLEPIVKTFDVGGQEYRAEFSGLTYSGRLAGSHLQAGAAGDVNFRFDLAEVTLKIEQIHIKSATLTADAGPIEVVLAHRRPAPLTICLRPRIEQGKLKLVETGTKFVVDDDNWYVSRPESIRRTGTGLTEYELTTGIVGGIYLQKDLIESEIRNLVPGMLRRMEQQLAVDVPHELAAMIWPLPVQAPRLRILPEELWINGDGLTVIATGLVGTSQNHGKPPRRFEGAGIAVADIPAVRELSIWASPRIVEAGSAVQVDDGMAQINVLDLPEPAFHALARPELWPGLVPAPGESLLDVELALLAPMRLETARGKDGCVEVTLIAPKVSLTPQTPDGKPIADRASPFEVRHKLEVSLLRPDHTDRDIAIHWSPTPKIVAGDDNGTSAAVVTEFGKAWGAWTNGQSGENPVEDLQVGESRLRIEAIDAAEPLLVARFAAPTIRVLNVSGSPFRYRVRDPESYWSGWLSLPLGTVHEFSVPASLEWQSRDGKHGRFLPGQEIRVEDQVPVSPVSN